MAEQKHLQDRHPGPTFTPDATITRGERRAANADPQELEPIGPQPSDWPNGTP